MRSLEDKVIHLNFHLGSNIPLDTHWFRWLHSLQLPSNSSQLGSHPWSTNLNCHRCSTCLVDTARTRKHSQH